MKLPVLMPDLPAQRFACHSCTNCCRELVVHLTPLDREKIDRHDWMGRIEGPAYVRHGHEYVLNHRGAGGCVFLRTDGKCLIHAEHGADEKPLACQLYPFTLEPEAQGVRVGIRFDCPSVARNEGMPLPTHAATVRDLTALLHSQMRAHFERTPRAMLLRPDRVLQEAELDQLLHKLDDWLRDTDSALEDRLIGMVLLAETLESIKLEQIKNQRFAELADLLIADLPATIAELGDLPEATARQRKLLRYSVFAYSEHVSLAQARAGFAASLTYRWDQLLRARRLAGGVGQAPRLGFQSSPVTNLPLDQVHRVKADAALSARDVNELLTRYLRTRVISRSFFGPASYDWPLTTGLCATVLSISVIGWLTRFLALSDGRWTFQWPDVVRAVGIVDRNAGRARELGARSARLRLTYLRADHGLLRLVRAYPIMPPRN